MALWEISLKKPNGKQAITSESDINKKKKKQLLQLNVEFSKRSC